MSSFRMPNSVTSRVAIFAEKVFELDRSRNCKFRGPYFHDWATYCERHEIIFAMGRFQRLQMEKIDNLTHTKIATLFMQTKFYQTNYYLEGVVSTSLFSLHI